MTVQSGVGIPAPFALSVLAKNWGLILLRGIAALGFGLMAIAWPGPTLLVLTWLFGAYMLADGLVSLAAALSGGAKGATWWLVLVGVLGVIAGLMTFFYPGTTDYVLLVFIAVWSMLRGISEIVGAIQMRKHIQNEWLLILHGAISLIFGIAVFLMPGAGALALITLIGIYAIVIGALLIGVALRLRKHRAEIAAA